MLKGIQVLDLAHVFPGHFAGQVLGDLGAEVIKIEDPKHPDLLRNFTPKLGGESAFFLAVNRNKKSLSLDIKSEKGKKIFCRLVEKADIIIDNFRPGHMDKLGLSYENLQAINPQLIYCNITGFGNNPAINYLRAAHDLNFIAESGILGATLSREREPVMPGISIGAFSGGFYAVIAILTALYNRTITNKGTFISSSLFDGLLQMSSIAASKIDPAHEEQMPINNYIYKTKDNKYVALAAIEKKFWERFLAAIDRLDLLQYHGSKAVEENKAFQELTRIFLEKTQEEWHMQLKDVDCCFSAVWAFSQAHAAPYVQAKNLLLEIDHPTAGKLKQFPLPFSFITEQATKKESPPLRGQHTEEILLGLGISQEEIALLSEEGIIHKQ